MKKIIFILGAVVCLSSCKSYMMSTVSSSNTKADQYTGILQLKNDSLDLSYNFSGEDAPMKIEIFNKLNEPLFINWEKSAIIVGDDAYSLMDDKLRIEASTSSFTQRSGYPNGNSTEGSINGTIQLSKNESFIPPKSKIARTSAILRRVKFPDIDKSLFRREKLNLADGTGETLSRETDFTEKDSPLTFRAYLTFYTIKDNQPKFFTLQQNFYVSKVTRTNVNPNNISGFDNNPGNVIILSKATGYAKTMGIVAATGLVIGAAAFGGSTNENTSSTK